MRSDDMLSQDEIDALLNGADELMEETEFERNPDIAEYLSLIERDAIGEIGNISYGHSATALSSLLRQTVKITAPNVSLVLRKNLEKEFPIPYVAVEVKFTEGFTGTNLLVIKQEDAAIIADLMLGGDGNHPPEILNEIHLSAIQEAMNQMMGSAATSMSTIFNKRVSISPPSIAFMNLPRGLGQETIPDSEELVRVSFRLIVGDIIDSNIMQLLPVQFAKNLASSLLGPGPALPEGKEKPQNAKQDTVLENPSGGHAEKHASVLHQEEKMYEKKSFNASPKNKQFFGSSLQEEEKPDIQPAVFSEFGDEPVFEPDVKNLDILLDIPLQVTVQLGKTTRSVKNILELTTGSIIELDKLAGEPVDILVNNRLIAKGEVVVIDENFGVRVTDIISQSDRIKNLK